MLIDYDSLYFMYKDYKEILKIYPAFNHIFKQLKKKRMEKEARESLPGD